MKTSELTGPALDWAVANALKLPETYFNNGVAPQFSTDWAQGGPIIEREEISVTPHHAEKWSAHYQYGQSPGNFKGSYGPTPLIAAMRCYVASKLGDEVDVPGELCATS